MTPTGTEARVIAIIAERQKLGIAKYGTTVAENPLSLRQWLQHALEESLDQAIYLQRAIEKLDKQEPFGYFKAEPFGWTDCAETDENAKELYERIK
jgi:hypothetical protein